MKQNHSLYPELDCRCKNRARKIPFDDNLKEKRPEEMDVYIT